MKATQELHDAGQSLWIDDITRDMLDSGRLAKMIAELSVTGLTSNPTIFEKAIGKGSDYDAAIEALVRKGQSDEALFFELALDDLSRAADLFLPVYKRTAGVDGFVSLEVSPLLAYDTQATIAEAKRLHAKAGRPNLFIKIPGTREGLPAIEAATFAGVPVNVTLLFSTADYLAAAEAYMRGLEKRVEAGLDPDVRSVASVFISRWDRAIVEQVPDELKNKLGIAVGQHAYRAYRDLIASDRWQRLENVGARPQRLLVRQHIEQGQARHRHAVYRRARRAEYRQHHAGGDAARLRRPRHASTACCRRRAATATPCSTPMSRPASTSTRWRSSCSRMAPRRSSPPGRTCSDRSAAKSKALA